MMTPVLNTVTTPATKVVRLAGTTVPAKADGASEAKALAIPAEAEGASKAEASTISAGAVGASKDEAAAAPEEAETALQKLPRIP